VDCCSPRDSRSLPALCLSPPQAPVTATPCSAPAAPPWAFDSQGRGAEGLRSACMPVLPAGGGEGRRCLGSSPAWHPLTVNPCPPSWFTAGIQPCTIPCGSRQLCALPVQPVLGPRAGLDAFTKHSTPGNWLPGQGCGQRGGYTDWSSRVEEGETIRVACEGPVDGFVRLQG